MTILNRQPRHIFDPDPRIGEDGFGRRVCRECKRWDWVIRPQGDNHRAAPQPPSLEAA